MPKVSTTAFPVSGLFGVVKPSGPTSMSVVETIHNLIVKSRLFVDHKKLEDNKTKKLSGRKARQFIKVGQGGTLDPLADGVLVIGVGKGTKKLSTFLDCRKEYRTTCLLGCETDSYDSQGSIVRRMPWKHITKSSIEANLPTFSGEIRQTPPIFSALKMDGMALYDYARKGIPLPRPIDARTVTVHSLELVDWLGSGHQHSSPLKELSHDEKVALAKALHRPEDAFLNEKHPEGVEETTDGDERPSAFVLNMNVSGGTYVRSIVHDLAHSVDSAGHVVTLTRSRQGAFMLEPGSDSEEEYGCVPWDVFDKASKDPGEADDSGWLEWEREVLKCLQVV